MTIDQLLDEGAPPVIAILRGVSPGEAVEIGAALIGAGIRMIEVPLNSPEPFASITALQEAFGDCALIGAGTVLDGSSVDRLAATGAELLVAPNTDAQVIARGIGHGRNADRPVGSLPPYTRPRCSRCITPTISRRWIRSCS